MKMVWLLLFGALLALFVVSAFQKLQIELLTSRLKTMEGNYFALASIERRLLGGVEKTTVDAAVGPVQSVGIPGVNATITVPGDWQMIGAGSTLNFKYGTATVSIDRRTVGDADLQQWFKTTFGLPTDFVATRVASANKAGFSVTGSDLSVIGPNQVKIGDSLAMDMTVSYLKQFDPESSTPMTQRFVAIKRGGDVIVVESNVATADSVSARAALDQVLNSLSFSAQ